MNAQLKAEILESLKFGESNAEYFAGYFHKNTTVYIAAIKWLKQIRDTIAKVEAIPVTESES